MTVLRVLRALGIIGTCVLAAGGATAAELTGSIEGRVTFRGEAPKSAVADEGGNRDPLILVDPKSRGVQDVVVHLKVPAMPLERGKSEVPKMDQVNNRFVPRVLAVRAGQRVVFTNSDAGNHNVRAAAAIATNEFNIFTGIEGSYQRAFAADPKGRPVRIGCDIHPWMRGWIYVFDHPFFAVTDSEGKFRISGVPPGKYEAVFAQPDLGYAETKTVDVAGQTIRIDAEARAGKAADRRLD